MNPVNGLIFDVADLFREAYGYKPITIPGLSDRLPDVNGINIPQANEKKRNTIKGSPIYGPSKDFLGREIVCPVILNVGGVDYEFPYVIVGIENKAIMEVTPMVERGAAVIEEIGVEAWKISIKGFLINPLNEFPDEELEQLNTVWKKRETIRLKCALTDIFLEGDDRVVIADLKVPAKAKVIGVKDFTMELIQDGILDLITVD